MECGIGNAASGPEGKRKIKEKKSSLLSQVNSTLVR